MSDQTDISAGAIGSRSEPIVHRGRKLSARPAWNLADLGTVLALLALLPPAWLLPERFWAPLWRGVARIPLFTSPGAIRRTGASIQAALGDVDRPRAEAIARDLKAAVYELRMQDLRAWGPDYWQPEVTLAGEAHLRAALAEGKGAILWVAPFVFNSGPTKQALHRAGYRVSHLSSPQHGFSETRFGIAWLNRIRCIPEDRHLAQRIVFDRAAPATAMRRMVRALKASEVVSIVAAATEGYEMIETPVFGGRQPVAVGAPRLAGLTGAPLLPLFTVRDPDGSYRVVIEAPIPIDPERPAGERCSAAAVAFFRRAEPWVRRFPEQWRSWSKWRRG